MLRLLCIVILASIFIVHIQASKSLHDLLYEKLSTLKKTESDALESLLSVLKDDRSALKLWNVYKDHLKKKYRNHEEDRQRMKAFIDNFKKIVTANHNFKKGLHSFKLEMNAFGDMDEKEFLNKYTGLKVPESEIQKQKNREINFVKKADKEKGKVDNVNSAEKHEEKDHIDGKHGKNQTKGEKDRQFHNLLPDYRRKKRALPVNIVLPHTVDYRPYMNPIENQGGCGSCYAFATAATIEGAYSVIKNQRISLSKQEIVDCGVNNGCHGGWFDETYTYIYQHSGLQTSAAYPYHTARSLCTARPQRIGGIRGYGRITSQNEEDMKFHLNLYGPLTIAMDGAPLQFFASGTTNMLDTPFCRKTTSHAVVIVGYGTENGRDYWLVRNSWGTNWGDQGYFKVARNKNGMCGVAIYAFYVLV